VISYPQNWTKFLGGYDILFDGSNSSDKDGDELSYLWYSDKDGYLGTDPVFRKPLSSNNHIITLHVFDGFHNVSTYVSITVVPCYHPDTDHDGLVDIIDDDDDNDGLLDIHEDINMNGLVDENETDPKDPDTDGDGVNDNIDVSPLDPKVWNSRIEDDPPLIFNILGIIFILFFSGIIVVIFLMDRGMLKKRDRD
jgi:hypothetical protein